jgi:hypothetical protein
MTTNVVNPAAEVRQVESLKDLARAINADEEKAGKAVLDHYIRQGERLCQAKDRCLRENKPWLAWLKENTKIRERTAQTYMKIYRAGPVPATVADKGLREVLIYLKGAEDLSGEELPVPISFPPDNERATMEFTIKTVPVEREPDREHAVDPPLAHDEEGPQPQPSRDWDAEVKRMGADRKRAADSQRHVDVINSLKNFHLMGPEYQASTLQAMVHFLKDQGALGKQQGGAITAAWMQADKAEREGFVGQHAHDLRDLTRVHMTRSAVNEVKHIMSRVKQCDREMKKLEDSEARSLVLTILRKIHQDLEVMIDK